MYTVFDTVRTKSGESAELGLLVGPSPGDPYHVGELLAHKGGNWSWHLERALAEELDGLVTRWYLASLDGVAVSNVMTVEAGGVGILGHVFTREEHRRQGLCQAIFDRLMPDFRSRGGLRLTLGTGFNSPPYWIYWRNGFRPVVPETGFMRYEAVDDFTARWFAPGPTRVVEYTWRHWPQLAQLFAEGVGAPLALYTLGLCGASNFEGPGIGLSRDALDHRTVDVRVLERETGEAVGVAMRRPDPKWQNRVRLLDLVTHPDHTDGLPALLAALPPVEGKVQSYLPATATARRAALEAHGFRLEGTFTGQLADGSDVVVYGRE